MNKGAFVENNFYLNPELSVEKCQVHLSDLTRKGEGGCIVQVSSTSQGMMR